MSQSGIPFSTRLKYLRKQRGINQKSYAKILGVGYHSYMRYEAGERNPPFDFLKSLSDLGVSIEWLLTGNGSPDMPVWEQIQRLEALVKYWESHAKLMEANIDLAKSHVSDRYGENAMTELFKGLGTIETVDERRALYNIPEGANLFDVDVNPQKKEKTK